MLKIHLDEQVDHVIAQALRQRGLDVTTTTDANLISAPDGEQLAYAVEHGRVIFTMDSDFLKLHHEGVPHRGIAYCPPGTETIGTIINLLEAIAKVMEAEEMRNHIEYL